MEKKNNTIHCGTSLSTLRTVAFIVLKLCNVIDWAWFWVLAPLWIPFAIVFVIIIAIWIWAGIIELRG